MLQRNPGDSDVYLNLTNGSDSQLMVLDEHLRVERSSSLMGDLKASMGPGILG